MWRKLWSYLHSYLNSPRIKLHNLRCIWYKTIPSLVECYFSPCVNTSSSCAVHRTFSSLTQPGVYLVFLNGNSLCEAVWSRKIHFQIMRFTCCLNMAFTWKSINWTLICMHDFTLESVAAVTGNFAYAFVRENVARVYMTLWRHNDVRKFDTDAILFWEIKCKKRNI